MIERRGILGGLLGLTVAAPAIVRAASLMRIKPIIEARNHIIQLREGMLYKPGDVEVLYAYSPYPTAFDGPPTFSGWTLLQQNNNNNSMAAVYYRMVDKNSQWNNENFGEELKTVKAVYRNVVRLKR